MSRSSATANRRVGVLLLSSLRRLALAAGLLLVIPAAAQAAPALTVSPPGQRAGGTLTLSGSGFDPDSPVTISFDDPATTASTTTDPTGSFSGVTFTVPAAAATGPHTLSATDGTNTAGASFNVDSLTVTPASGGTGAGLSISGSGWNPGDEVDIDLGIHPVCQLIADNSGEISGTLANGCQVPYAGPAGYRALTATDPGTGAQARAPAGFLIPVTAAFTPPTGPVATDAPVTFDASASTAYSGTPTNYLWEFDDGTEASGASVSHTFTEAGTYLVTLIVSDASGDVAQATEQVQVEGPLTAQLGMNPSGPVAAGTVIQFDGTRSRDSKGSVDSYQWNFGDGQSSTLPSPTHAYSTPGTYTVTLTVADAAGNIDATSVPITITDQPPLAAFTPTSATVLAGSDVTFDGTGSSSPDGSITGYAWNFGDGSSSTAARAVHRYLTTGTFPVTLTVTDSFGDTSTVTHQITVIAPPPIQTLILTPVANPAIVKWSLPSRPHRRVVDLGERLFCPGNGPGCTATISSTSSSLVKEASGAQLNRKTRSKMSNAGTKTIRIAPNGSGELVFRLSARALTWLTEHQRLPLRIKLVVVRGDQTTTRIYNLTLRVPRPVGA